MSDTGMRPPASASGQPAPSSSAMRDAAGEQAGVVMETTRSEARSVAQMAQEQAQNVIQDASSQARDLVGTTRQQLRDQMAQARGLVEYQDYIKALRRHYTVTVAEDRL